MDLQGWSGNFVTSDHCNTQGLIQSYDKSGDEIYINFYSSIFYDHGQDYEFLNLDEGDLLHFDACHARSSNIILGHQCSYTADLVWIGKKPQFSDSSSSSYSTDDEDCSENEGDCYDDEYTTEEEDESENGEEASSSDESDQDSEYSEEDDNGAVGFVGKVHSIVNSHTAVLKCQINGNSSWIGLERCRLYVHGKLSNCLHPIDKYINVGENVNFDAAPVAKHPVFSFRVITAWIGKKPTSDEFVTPAGAPTHLLSSPWPTNF